MALREPWRSVVRAGLRSYGGLGALIGIIAYGQFTLIEQPRSLAQCVRHYTDRDDLDHATLIGYAVYKALLWPVSLVWTTAGGEVRPTDWVMARYDPFEGSCRD